MSSRYQQTNNNSNSSSINKKIIAYILFFSFVNISFSYGFHSQFITPTNNQEKNFLLAPSKSTDIIGSFIGSGIDPINYTFYHSEISRWKNEIDYLLPPNATQEQIARQIGYYLHDKVYTSYKLSATTLKEVFESGYFNCLSATVLMMIMLKLFGIEVDSIVLPTHVYTLATLDGKKVEIENTMREGLAISQDKEIQKQFNKLTGFNYADASQKKMVINWNQTLGLLYSNRSYFNAQNKEYEQAFQNMMKAQVFLSDAPSEQRNLIAGYLNYSYFIYKKRQATLQEFLKTLSILEEGIQRFPNYKTLKGNYLKGVDLVLEKMIQANADKNEIKHLVQASQPYLNTVDFQRLQKSYFVRMSLHHMRTNKNLNEASYFIKGFWEFNARDKDAQSLIQEYTHSLIMEKLKDPTHLQQDQSIIDAINEFPKSLTTETLACYYSGLAKNNYNANKFNQSVQIMLNAKEKLGNNYLVTQNGFAYAVNSAQQLINQKKYRRAIGFYKDALSFKKDRNVFNNLGILYEQEISKNIQKNNLTEVHRLVAESKKFTPNHPALRLIHREYN